MNQRPRPARGLAEALGPWLLALLTMALIILAASQARPAPAAERADPRDRNAPLAILCLGDSLTAGTPHPREYSYPSVLAGLLAGKGWSRAKVVNQGIPGIRIGGIAARLDRPGWLDVNPDVVLLMAGTNNLGRGQAPEGVVWELGRLAEKVAGHVNPGGGRPLVIVSLLPPSWDFDASRRLNLANQLIRGGLPGADRLVTANWDAFYNPAWARADARLMEDGLHLTREGYALMARNWLAVLEEALAGRASGPTPADPASAAN